MLNPKFVSLKDSFGEIKGKVVSKELEFTPNGNFLFLEVSPSRFENSIPLRIPEGGIEKNGLVSITHGNYTMSGRLF